MNPMDMKALASAAAKKRRNQLGISSPETVGDEDGGDAAVAAPEVAAKVEVPESQEVGDGGSGGTGATKPDEEVAVAESERSTSGPSAPPKFPKRPPPQPMITPNIPARPTAAKSASLAREKVPVMSAGRRSSDPLRPTDKQILKMCQMLTSEDLIKILQLRNVDHSDCLDRNSLIKKLHESRKNDAEAGDLIRQLEDIATFMHSSGQASSRVGVTRNGGIGMSDVDRKKPEVKSAGRAFHNLASEIFSAGDDVEEKINLRCVLPEFMSSLPMKPVDAAKVLITVNIPPVDVDGESGRDEDQNGTGNERSTKRESSRSSSAARSDPALSSAEIRDVAGYMKKKGHTSHALTSDYKRRWFELDTEARMLTYFKDEVPPDPLKKLYERINKEDMQASVGGIRSSSIGFTLSKRTSVRKSTSTLREASSSDISASSGDDPLERIKEKRNSKMKGEVDLDVVSRIRPSDEKKAPEFAFDLETPSRTWVIVPENKEDQGMWLRALCKVVKQEAVSLDYLQYLTAAESSASKDKAGSAPGSPVQMSQDDVQNAVTSITVDADPGMEITVREVLEKVFKKRGDLDAGGASACALKASGLLDFMWTPDTPLRKYRYVVESLSNESKRLELTLVTSKKMAELRERASDHSRVSTSSFDGTPQKRLSPIISSTIDGESPVRRVADAISTASPSEAAGIALSAANAEADKLLASFKSGFSASNANLSVLQACDSAACDLQAGKTGAQELFGSDLGCPARLDRLLTIGMEMEATGNRRNSSSRLTTTTTQGQRREPPKVAGDGSAGGAAALGTAGGEALQRLSLRGASIPKAAVKCPLRFRILSVEDLICQKRVKVDKENTRLEPLNIVNAGVRVYVLSGGVDLQSVPLESKKVPYSPLMKCVHFGTSECSQTSLSVATMPHHTRLYFELFGEVADEKNDGETHVLATVSIQCCDFERNMIEGKRVILMWPTTHVSAHDVKHGVPESWHIDDEPEPPKWKSTGGENIVRPVLHLQFDTFSSCVNWESSHDHALEDEEEIDLHVEKSGYLEMEINTYLRNERKKMWFVLDQRLGNLSWYSNSRLTKMKGSVLLNGAEATAANEKNVLITRGKGSTMKETRSSCFRIEVSPADSGSGGAGSTNSSNVIYLHSRSRQDAQQWMDAIAKVGMHVQEQLKNGSAQIIAQSKGKVTYELLEVIEDADRLAQGKGKTAFAALRDSIGTSKKLGGAGLTMNRTEWLQGLEMELISASPMHRAASARMFNFEEAAIKEAKRHSIELDSSATLMGIFKNQPFASALLDPFAMCSFASKLDQETVGALLLLCTLSLALHDDASENTFTIEKLREIVEKVAEVDGIVLKMPEAVREGLSSADDANPLVMAQPVLNYAVESLSNCWDQLIRQQSPSRTAGAKFLAGNFAWRRTECLLGDKKVAQGLASIVVDMEREDMAMSQFYEYAAACLLQLNFKEDKVRKWLQGQAGKTPHLPRHTLFNVPAPLNAYERTQFYDKVLKSEELGAGEERMSAFLKEIDVVWFRRLEEDCMLEESLWCSAMEHVIENCPPIHARAVANAQKANGKHESEDGSAGSQASRPLRRRRSVHDPKAFLRDAEAVSKLMKLDPLYQLTSKEKALLWTHRRRLPELFQFAALPKLLRAVNWMSPYEVRSTIEMVKEWPLPENKQFLLELLDEPFQHEAVRRYAVNGIDKLDDHTLASCLPQLVQAMKYEPYHVSCVSQLLMKRALQAPLIIGLPFFWACKVEMNGLNSRERYGMLLTNYLLHCGRPQRELVTQQHELWSQQGLFAGVAAAVYSHKGQGKKKYLEVLQRELRKVDKSLPATFTLPLDPRIECSGIHFGKGKCRVMSSAKLPLWLTFINAEEGGDDISVMFKAGDDLRQDSMVLQLIRVMDDMWKNEGLDLCLSPYKCVSTWNDGGMLEIVMNSRTTADIHTRYGGKFGALSLTTFDDWIRDNNEDPKDPQKLRAAKDMFVRSCVGYCVATYVMGIGDRHNDNIMIKKNGQYFHIDFGHFLGNFKYALGGMLKRDATKFVFGREMAYVMDYPKGELFLQFVSHCKAAFNVLRTQSTALINLFILMVPAGMPELTTHEDIGYLRDMLAPDMTDAEAGEHFRKEIEDARNNKYKRFDNTIHILKHS
eukprot:g2842.t1